MSTSDLPEGETVRDVRVAHTYGEDAVATPAAPVGGPEGGVATTGTVLATAACEAEHAGRALARMALRLDAAGLEITEPVAGVIADVFDIASGLTALADGIGAAAVDRRAAR